MKRGKELQWPSREGAGRGRTQLVRKKVHHKEKNLEGKIGFL